MNAIEVLHREHMLVRKLLRCLGALTVETRVTGSLDAKAARPLLHLLERFVDWGHQDKEELHLFPHMLTHATAEEAERLGRVFAEHSQERRRLVSMYLHMEGASRGRSASVDRFITNSLLYQRLQNKHVEAEESFVLPLAQAILTPADDRRIRRGFHEIDRRLGMPKRIEEQVAVLCQRFGLEPPTSRVPRPPLIRT
jgi:hemerythrin-like domain-containing protein